MSYLRIVGGINKREHLIKTGQELIWSKGYDLCSIKDITSAAGLPKGSFYHYFDSKEKFALEAMKEFIEANPETVNSDDPDIGSLESLIQNRIDAIIKIEFTRECYMSVMCHAFSNQEEHFRLAVLESIDKSNETMKSLLIELKRKGLLRDSLALDELEEFVDFAWRGARLKARIEQSSKPLEVFKKYLINLVSKV